MLQTDQETKVIRCCEPLSGIHATFQNRLAVFLKLIMFVPMYWQEEFFCLPATEDEEEERKLEECRKRNLEVIKAKQRPKMAGVSEGDETAGDWNLEEAGHMREETKEKEEVYLQRISLP